MKRKNKITDFEKTFQMRKKLRNLERAENLSFLLQKLYDENFSQRYVNTNVPKDIKTIVYLSHGYYNYIVEFKRELVEFSFVIDVNIYAVTPAHGVENLGNYNLTPKSLYLGTSLWESEFESLEMALKCDKNGIKK